MATEVLMPRLSDSMEEGVIIKWLVEPGTEVSVGDELVEIETDKANMTYEADDSGLVHPVADEGDELPVGAPIALLLSHGEEPPSGSTQKQAADSLPPSAATQEGEAGAADGFQGGPPLATAQEGAEGAEAGEPARNGRIKASPLAKRIAADKGVDLHALQGSGPGGRIVKKDVEAAQPGAAPSERGTADLQAAGSPETAKGATEVVELSRLQKTVSRRMAESKATAPHFYLSTEIDMSGLFASRKKVKASTPEGGTVPSFNDMVVKACAIALTEFPKANGSYVDGRIELHSRVNVGVAVAAQDALVVPTVFDADRKGLVQIAKDTRELAKKVREGTISPPELSGGTFTVSNLGMYGISHFDAVINTPQAAILAVGAIEERPVVRDGQIVPAHMMSVTLSCDHRILYGAEGAEFLARVKALLEEPLGLAL